MANRRASLMVLISFPLIAACGARSVDTDSDTDLLTAQLEEIAEVVNTSQTRDFPAAYAAFFTDDATLLTAQGAVIEGKPNVLAFYDRVAANVASINVEYPEAPTILIDSSVAVRWYKGVTRAIYSGQDTVTVASTQYLDVLQKQQDGSWKIRWHVWNRR